VDLLVAKNRKPKTAQRSGMKRLGYSSFRRFLHLFMLVFYRVRVFGITNVPKTGSGLICSNHQSHWDPPAVGHGIPRRLNFIARNTLFKFKPFAWAIDFLDAIPLDQDGMSIAGIKETLKRLKNNELVLIFPEGSRTYDGEMGEFQGGFIILARRTKTPLIPTAIDGAFQAWPRTRKYPFPGRIAISYGSPIEFAQYKDLSDDQLLSLLKSKIEIEFAKCRKAVGYKKIAE